MANQDKIGDVGSSGIKKEKRGRPKAVTPERFEQFLENYRKIGVKVSSCNMSGFEYCALKTWFRDNPDDEKRMNEAYDLYRESLEREAYRRAVDGEDVPLVYKGEVVGTKSEKSDRLLELLLKGAYPDKYSHKNIDAKVELTGGVVALPEKMDKDEFMRQYKNDAKD